MNTVTSAEANRRFTEMTRKVDEEGKIMISKNGKGAYIMMTVENYETLRESALRGEFLKPLWLREKNTIHHVESAGDMIKITSLSFTDETFKEVEGYLIGEAPKESISVSFENEIPCIGYSWRKGRWSGGVASYLLSGQSPDKKLCEEIERFYTKTKDMDKDQIQRGFLRAEEEDMEFEIEQ